MELLIVVCLGSVVFLMIIKGKYLLSATMRADGSSKYQEKWGYFPSVGAAWNISEEDFMNDQKWVDYMKIRAS